MAAALAAAKAAVRGGAIFRANGISRADVKMLREGGWVLEMHTGWLALVTPGLRPGDTVPYISNYWEFAGKYLAARLGDDYALSPAASIAVHTDSAAIPRQLGVHTRHKTRNIVQLSHDLSIAVYNDRDLDVHATEVRNGLRILSLEKALSRMPAAFFRSPSPELVAAISMVRNIPELTRLLLADLAAPAAMRIAAALRSAGRDRDASQIERAVAAAGLTVADSDAVGPGFSVLQARPKSALAARIRAAWAAMAVQVAGVQPPVAPSSLAAFRRKRFATVKARIAEVYVADAYHSLSIEGYQVTDELIAKVAVGRWDPAKVDVDRKAADALAARGYYEAFQEVLASIERIHAGTEVRQTVEHDFLRWREGLFAPEVKAGILPPDVLAGYRNKPVYIRGSMHVPPAPEKLMDAVDAVFECIGSEPSPWVRAVLGHFFFVYVHPFTDGNGRVGRFLMNALLVTSGLPWTVIRVSRRAVYMAALEAASVGGDAADLARFVAEEMTAGMTR